MQFTSLSPGSARTRVPPPTDIPLLLRRSILVAFALALTTCVSEHPLAPRSGGWSDFSRAAATNLLQDPGFEAGGAAWRNSASSGRLVQGLKFHSGTRALRILAAAAAGRVVYQEQPASAGERYVVSGWFATDALGGSGVSLETAWLDTLGLPDNIPAAHLLLSQVVGRASGTADWVELSDTVAAPSGTRAVRVGIRLAQEPDGSGKAAADDLALLAVPSTPVDSLPPRVTLTAPAEGAVLSGMVRFSADASDDIGVIELQFRSDGQPLGAILTAAPWAIDVGAASLGGGAHILDAIARDDAGNETTSAPVHVTVSSTRPRDIVVILTDDQRFDQMPEMPLTSALLNAETVRFEQAFVTTSLCCPSRSSILTGEYVHNHGVYSNSLPNGGALKFNPASTLATWLHGAGYRTAMIGKYLNDYQKLSPVVPPGWDDFQGLLSPLIYFGDSINNNGTVVHYGTRTEDYITDVLSRLATDFIRATPADQPLFLYFTPTAPHGPATPHPSDVGRYANYPNWRPPSFNEPNVSDKPAWIRATKQHTQAEIDAGDAFHRNQLETLQAVDRSVDSIVAALKAANRWDNTLVIFLSDNGYTWNEHRLMDRKACPYEECIRVPLWIRAPGLSARTDSSIVANIDLAPTITDWAGVTPAGLINGRSLLPLLENPGAPWRADLLIEHLKIGAQAPDMQGIRTARYMYNELTTGERELYDLVTDPYQLTNVASLPANAVLVATLKARLALLRVE